MRLTEFSGMFPNLCHHLLEAKRHSRAGQSYLLRGDKADFIEEFALAWAQVAACQHPEPDGSPCGQCRPCTLLEQQQYPELRILRPQSKSRLITIAAIRDFEHWLSMATPPGLLKIGLIAEAECLGTDAQNAFLKTLEEPPPQSMLLLTTTNARRLLPTIISRCQTLSLLRNRTDYEIAERKQLYQLLAPLRRQAGAALGFRTSVALSQLLAGLRKEAEAMSDELRDHRWDGNDDKKIQKQLDEELTARIEAEYVRRRESLLGGLLAWFLQRMLIASGVRADLLPHQEMLPSSESLLANPPSPDEAEQDIRYAEKLIQCLRSNVDERLALDAFCLNVSLK